MGKTVEKKIWPEFYDEVASGKKKYQLRLNDFEISDGDTLVLREWNPETKEYTGRKLEKVVTTVHTFTHDDLTRFYPKDDVLEKGLHIISFE